MSLHFLWVSMLLNPDTQRESRFWQWPQSPSPVSWQTQSWDQFWEPKPRLEIRIAGLISNQNGPYPLEPCLECHWWSWLCFSAWLEFTLEFCPFMLWLPWHGWQFRGWSFSQRQSYWDIPCKGWRMFLKHLKTFVTTKLGHIFNSMCKVMK